MKKNKFILIISCVFILIMFSACSTANDNINNINNTDLSINNEYQLVKSSGQIHVVDGSAYNQMIDPTIQDAIDRAKNGDIIEITGTEYVHCHFVINKNLTIRSSVGTTMSTCPSNTDGSKGIGIFYISPEGSGTTLSGFTLINDKSKSGSTDPYAIYINGANQVTIINCSIEKTEYGPGIYINNAKNTQITDSIVKNSQKGIYIENSDNIIIKDNSISSNNFAGISIGANCKNIQILTNTINANNFYGIYLASANNTKIYSNRIYENRDNPVVARAEKGTGIYVDTTANKLEIKGNLISENGRYGIYDSPKFTNMVDQYVQIVDGNFFIKHEERGIFHADPNGQTTIVYVWSNYYSDELFCGGTSYEPDVLIGSHSRDLIMSKITEIENGVYSVSFIRKDTGAIATSLNSIEVTFFLNKKNTSPTIGKGDVYRICPVVNGTAIADFRNETYLATGNVVVSMGPGNGIITYENSGSRPSQKFLVDDTHIPTSMQPTTISGNSLTKYYGNSNQYVVTLLANGNALANKDITVKINGNKTTRKTDQNGNVLIDITLIPNIYNVELMFEGDENYEPSSNSDVITVQSTISGKDIVKYYRNGTQYAVSILDKDGNPAINSPVKFTIIGATYTINTDSNGVATLPINLSPKDYVITAYNTITGESCTNNIKVLPINTKLLSSDIEMNYKDGTSYAVQLLDENNNPMAGKTVSLYINGASFKNVKYDRTTNNQGIATLPINLNTGEYTITAKYETQSTTTKVIVKLSKSSLKAQDIEMNYKDGTSYAVQLLDGKGMPLAGKTVSLYLNGKNFKNVKYDRTTNNQGIATLPINLNTGEYTITAKYETQSTTTKVVVKNEVKYTLKSENIEMTVKDGTAYTVQLLDGNSKPISGKTISLYLNGKNFKNVKYDRTTNNQGIATLPINLNVGEYTIKAVFNNIEKTTAIKVLSQSSTPIQSKNIKMEENDRIPFTVNIVDEKGNPIAGEKVTFKIIGASYSKTTDSNGMASLPINLAVGKYTISSEYKNYAVSNTIEVAKATSKIDTELSSNDLNGDIGEDLYYVVTLKNKNDKPIYNQNINITIDGKNYKATTNVNGEAKLKINLKTGVYTAISKYDGNSIYNPSHRSSKITISQVQIVKNATNDEIQNIINGADENTVIKLTAESYNGISIIINKPITLTTNSSIIKGEKNKNVITLNVDGANINGFEIIVENASAINVNGNNNNISNCTIKNSLNPSLIDDYNSGKITLPGNGIEIISGENNTIENNEISNFKNGIYLENSKNTTIQNNTITKNNYGIEFGENVSATTIQNNKINDNIGLITLEVVEGPLGYGISIRDSGVDVNILNNEINNNYMGIFIDAKNCSGIKITGNSISNNTIEGLTFNENYTFAEGFPEVIVENNAIYNNAKGPSMIILGEVSANPAGIYGPGEWDDTKKLYLGPNWYGTNKYTTWGNITGPGTICPRISTTLITFNMSCIEPGKYDISFYNNGQLATALPDFDIYFILNYYTDNEIEVIANVHEGKATIEFPAENYYDAQNIIEASSTSLFDSNRPFKVMYTYAVPDSEIKK